jgi:hypothetical protein
MGLIFAPFACFVVSHRPKVLVSERSLHYATVAPIGSYIAEWITYLENKEYHAFLEGLKGLSYSDKFLADHEALVQQRFEQFKQLPEDFFRGLIRLLHVAHRWLLVRGCDHRSEGNPLRAVIGSTSVLTTTGVAIFVFPPRDPPIRCARCGRRHTCRSCPQARLRHSPARPEGASYPEHGSRRTGRDRRRGWRPRSG